MGMRWLCGFIYDISASKSYLSSWLVGARQRRRIREREYRWVDKILTQTSHEQLSFISISESLMIFYFLFELASMWNYLIIA